MIYGNLVDIGIYKGINKNLDKAIEFIITGKYKEGNYGVNQVEGDKIFFNYPENAVTKDEKDGFLESHKKYIDIHIVIEGEENIGYVSPENVVAKCEYNGEGDFIEYSGKLENKMYMDNNKFLILFPGEPHMALVNVNENSKKVKKVIFKVMA